MPKLTVENRFSCTLPGLGKIAAFESLSQKRITKVAREALRKTYGEPNVEVSCIAEFGASAWAGRCVIGGQPFKYRIV